MASAANLGQAILAAAQARLALSGQWALNEKGIVERADLGETNIAIIQLDPGAAVEHVAQLLEVDWI